jgi:hypothetical protein
MPLFINCHYNVANPSMRDELGIHHALRLHDRLCGINLHLPPSTLHKFLMLMDAQFQMLEHLSLSFRDDKITTLTLPNKFQGPHLRHLTLLSVCLPLKLRFLSSTVSLVTLVLTNIRTSGYIPPRILIARLQALPQLEHLLFLEHAWKIDRTYRNQAI